MITVEGYTRRTFDDLLTKREERAREMFGEDIRTDEKSVMGKILRIGAYSDAETEELAELIYYAIFPNSAFGLNLDRLCVFVGISRNPATAAMFKVKVTGEPDAVIPIGFLVSTESEINYYNTLETIVGEDGTCEIIVECEELGEIGNVVATDIINIVNPAADIENVQGVEVYRLGTDEESDTALRKRFETARDGFGTSNEAAILAAIMRIPTVKSVDMIINEGDEVDEGGRPPKSFECFVQGGEEHHKDIAEAIYEKKALGIKTHGKISQVVYDSAGREKIIKFSHTTDIPVYVKVGINKSTAFDNVNGVIEIQENICENINGLGVGADVVLSSLYGLIHSVTGVVDVTSLQLSTDGATWSNENIVVDEYETAICQNVEVVL